MQGISNGKNGDALDLKLKRLNQRPISMYETREGLNKMSNWHAFKTQVTFDFDWFCSVIDC